MAIFEVLNNQQSYFNRYFRRNEGSTDYATIPEVTLSGDFVIEFDFLTLGDGKFFSGTDVGNAELVVEVLSGTVRVFAYNSSAVYQGAIEIAGGYNDGKLHHVKISMAGTSISVVIDDSLSSSGVFSTLDYFVISNIYRRSNNTGFLSGILANLKIWDNGTLVRNYPINDNSDILRNRATVLGAELVDVGDVTLGVGWYIDGEDLVYSGTGTDLLTINTSLTSSETYLSSIKAAYGTFRDRLDQVNFTGVTESNRALTYSGGILQIQSNGEPCRINIVSIRKSDGYGTIINGNADDWGLFDRQANGDWFGQELVVNGGFDTDSDWTLSGTSIADGMLVFGTGTTYADQINLSAGSLYQFSFDVVDYNGASIGLSSLTVNPSYLVSAVGKYIVEDSAVNNYVRLVSTGSDLNAIDNVSVKEVLKNA
jgi:hypothetical protein